MAASLRVEPDWDRDEEHTASTECLHPSQTQRPERNRNCKTFRRGTAQEDLSVETGARAEAKLDIDNGDILPAKMVEVFHAESSGHAFGHPFLLRVKLGERAQSVVTKLQSKLCVPAEEFQQWRLLTVEGNLRTPLEQADECRTVLATPLPWNPASHAFCLERQHPAQRARSPVANRALRLDQPLTIRAR